LDDKTLEEKNNNIFLEMTQKCSTYCCTVNKFEVLENTLKLGQKKNILSLQVHKITGRTEEAFPKHRF
jgi:hypothetical protein